MRRHRHSLGYSLVEVVIATTIFIVAVAGVYGLYCASITALLAGDYSAVSSVNLLQRLDQLRRTGWANATSASYISSLLGTPIPATGKNIPLIVTEQVTVSSIALPQASPAATPAPSPLPSPTATPAPFTVTRSGSTVRVSPSPAPSMASQSAVNVTVSLTWKDNANRQHTREMSTVLSNAALSR